MSLTPMLWLLWLLTPGALAARILLLPVMHKSHVIFFSVTARGLQKAGHVTDVLTLESRRTLVERSGVTPLVYKATRKNELIDDPDKFEQLALSTGKNVMLLVGKMTLASMEMCDSMFANDELMRILESNKYDLILVDGIDYGRCLYAIPYRLGVKYITLSVKHDAWKAGLPAIPTLEHMPLIGNIITENATLTERIKSLVIYIYMFVGLPLSVLDDSAIARYAPDRPTTTYAELFRGSEMWLIKLETYCLDWPHIYSNHYRFIGGIGLDDVKSLPADLEQFIRGTTEGVIVMALGSAVSKIPSEMLTKVLAAFAKTKYRLIMRHTGDIPGDVPSNVHVMPWIPQVDLLGHPNTKAFITHGGANGQLEALHHAVPLITIPVFADQFYNADRAERKGLGVTLDRHSFTSEQLTEAIEAVTSATYQGNMRRASKLFHSLPPAEETILFWVEHVIAFGGEHLRPVSLKVPVWRLFMLDILAILLVLILTVYTCILCVLHRLYTKCSRNVSSSKKMQ